VRERGAPLPVDVVDARASLHKLLQLLLILILHRLEERLPHPLLRLRLVLVLRRLVPGVGGRLQLLAAGVPLPQIEGGVVEKPHGYCAGRGALRRDGREESIREERHTVALRRVI